ncbi:MAG: DUF2630 family protein [Acidobacteria bacterium]|nr:DUF2630 family protein [Acidobacteriota bacterium]
MNEVQIHQHIKDLVETEHQLRNDASASGDVGRTAKLRDIEVQLDQCWDLLRQRQAKRDARENPNDAALR